VTITHPVHRAPETRFWHRTISRTTHAAPAWPTACGVSSSGYRRRAVASRTDIGQARQLSELTVRFLPLLLAFRPPQFASVHSPDEPRRR
jgi:hypothetical protein